MSTNALYEFDGNTKLASIFRYKLTWKDLFSEHNEKLFRDIDSCNKFSEELASMESVVSEHNEDLNKIGRAHV